MKEKDKKKTLCKLVSVVLLLLMPPLLLICQILLYEKGLCASYCCLGPTISWPLGVCVCVCACVYLAILRVLPNVHKLSQFLFFYYYYFELS